MAIQVNGCTVIDDGRNIINVNDIRVGLVTITSSGNIETPGTITGAGFSVFSPSVSFSPGIGTTSVNPVSTASIVLSFPDSVSRGTGTVELRAGSAGGTLIKSYNAATAPEIQVLDNTWVLYTIPESYSTTPAPPVLPFTTEVFLVIPSTAITGFVGVNTTGGVTYSFTTSGAALGSVFEGGRLICRAGGTNWVVAPNTSEVSRTWYLRNDANTRAQQVSGCTGWFVPTVTQLQNPGYTCRTFWDSFSSTPYWSSTEHNATNACYVLFNTGTASVSHKNNTFCVRAFRCVTY